MKKVSKQAQAKIEQGYVTKPVWPVCGNCDHFHSERRVVETDHISGTEYTEEIGLRCGLGGFKVGKSGACEQHKKKEGE